MLITLAAMVLILTAAVTAARVASTARLADRIDFATELADELLIACEAPIQRWLGEESAAVVLPLESETPAVEVLHDRIGLGQTQIEIYITGYDQLGMIPLAAARSGSPLRLAVPEQITEAVEAVEFDADQAPGLDVFAGGAIDSPSAFPSESHSSSLIFGIDETQPLAATEPPKMALAIGGLVATPTAGRGLRVRINVHTAPIKLLETALRAAGRGGIEQILAARSDGEPVAIGSLPVFAEERLGSTSPLLVGVSDAWAFRIDIRVNIVHRSWWAVYQKSGSAWPCVQRLAIDE